MRKKIALIVLLLVAIFSFGVLDTYGVFESRISGVAEEELANWNIVVNGSTVTGSSGTFEVTNFSYSETGTNIRDNTFAPGSEVWFDVIIDPRDTQVSIKYDISADVSSASNVAIRLSSASLVDGDPLIRTDSNVFSGIMALNENPTSATIKIGVVWDIIENNEETDFNSSMQDTLNIPIVVNLSQYLGEELEEYIEEEETASE